MRLSVVIPAFNEKNVILDTVNELISSLNYLNPEIIIVDDGSLDGTYEKVVNFANKHKNVRVVKYDKNNGKGFAVRYGFMKTIGDLVAFIDADLDIHPKQILRLIEEMDRTDADIIVGSKRHIDSKVIYPINRKIYSYLYYIFVKLLFRIPVKDTQVGLKLYRRKVLEDICPSLLVKEYAFDIEILANAHRLGYKLGEAPVEIKNGFGGCINKKSIYNMFVDTLAVFYRMKILKYYDRYNTKYDKYCIIAKNEAKI